MSTAKRQRELFEQNTNPRDDGKRLRTLFVNVRDLMTGKLFGISTARSAWWTLGEIVAHVGGSEASVSARLRDLRKKQFGGFIVERRRRGEAKRGLFEYRVTRGAP